MLASGSQVVLTPPYLVPARYNGQRDALIAEPKINLTPEGTAFTIEGDVAQVIASLICSPRKVPEFRDHAQWRSPIPACVKVGADPFEAPQYSLRFGDARIGIVFQVPIAVRVKF